MWTQGSLCPLFLDNIRVSLFVDRRVNRLPNMVAEISSG
jgi:hypothetical protein